MAITATDILYKLSINSSPGDSAAQADPNDSIGGYISTTQITDATGQNLFDDITGARNEALEVDYRGFFVHNNHGSLTWQSVVVWLSAEVAGGADTAIALDGIGATAVNSGSTQMERLPDDTTAPTGESFSAPTTKGTGLSIGNLTSDQVHGIWVRRTATNSAAQSNDGVTIRCEGDTEA